MEVLILIIVYELK